jgi:hypothetical protein
LQAHSWLSSRLEAGIEGDEVEWIVDEIVNESFGAVAGRSGRGGSSWRIRHGSCGPSTPGESDEDEFRGKPRRLGGATA